MENCHGVTSQLAWEIGKRVGNSPRSCPAPSPPPVPPVPLPSSCFWGANQVPKPMLRIYREVPLRPTPRSAAPVRWGQTLAARKALSSLRKGAGSSRWHGDVSSAVAGRRQRGDGPGGSAGNGSLVPAASLGHPKGWWHSSWGISAMSWQVGTHLLVFLPRMEMLTAAESRLFQADAVCSFLTPL